MALKDIAGMFKTSSISNGGGGGSSGTGSFTSELVRQDNKKKYEEKVALEKLQRAEDLAESARRFGVTTGMAQDRDNYRIGQDAKIFNRQGNWKEDALALDAEKYKTSQEIAAEALKVKTARDVVSDNLQQNKFDIYANEAGEKATDRETARGYTIEDRANDALDRTNTLANEQTTRDERAAAAGYAKAQEGRRVNIDETRKKEILFEEANQAAAAKAALISGWENKEVDVTTPYSPSQIAEMQNEALATNDENYMASEEVMNRITQPVNDYVRPFDATQPLVDPAINTDKTSFNAPGDSRSALVNFLTGDKKVQTISDALSFGNNAKIDQKYIDRINFNENQEVFRNIAKDSTTKEKTRRTKERKAIIEDLPITKTEKEKQNRVLEQSEYGEKAITEYKTALDKDKSLPQNVKDILLGKWIQSDGFKNMMTTQEDRFKNQRNNDALGVIATNKLMKEAKLEGAKIRKEASSAVETREAASRAVALKDRLETLNRQFDNEDYDMTEKELANKKALAIKKFGPKK